MTEVIEETYELVDEGLISEKDFRDFTITNSVRLYAGLNHDFFKGTVCEASVARLFREKEMKVKNSVARPAA